MGRAAVVGRAAGQHAADGVQLADTAVAHQLANAAIFGRGALLAAGLPNNARAFDLADDPASLGDGERQRLLAIDMFPGPRRGDRDVGVPMVGRPDVNRVEVFRGEQFAEVFVRRAAFSAVVLVDQPPGGLAASHRPLPIARAFTVDVTDGDDADTLVFHKALDPARAVIPGADETDGHLVAWRVLSEHRAGDDGREGERRR